MTHKGNRELRKGIGYNLVEYNDSTRLGLLLFSALHIVIFYFSQSLQCLIKLCSFLLFHSLANYSFHAQISIRSFIFQWSVILLDMFSFQNSPASYLQMYVRFVNSVSHILRYFHECHVLKKKKEKSISKHKIVSSVTRRMNRSVQVLLVCRIMEETKRSSVRIMRGKVAKNCKW